MYVLVRACLDNNVGRTPIYTTLDAKLNPATPLNGYAGKSSENFQKVQLLQLFCLSTCHVYAVCVCVCVCVCVWVSCQLPPRGEPGNTLSGNSVAKADSCLCISCGVVQITEVVNILDLASLGKSNCTREMSGIFPDISSRALRAQGSVIIERWTASRFKVCVCVCVSGWN